jgi:histone acetyltransferase HTATIP
MVVDMATNMHHCEFPYIDNGLREAIVAQIDARLPAIIEDEGAWGELVKDNIVLRALHVHQCDKRDDVDGKAVVTPPCLPVKGVKNGRAQDRCSGG